MDAGRIEQPLDVPRSPRDVGFVAFEISGRHRFVRESRRGARGRDRPRAPDRRPGAGPLQLAAALPRLQPRRRAYRLRVRGHRRLFVLWVASGSGAARLERLTTRWCSWLRVSSAAAISLLGLRIEIVDPRVPMARPLLVFGRARPGAERPLPGGDRVADARHGIVRDYMPEISTLLAPSHASVDRVLAALPPARVEPLLAPNDCTDRMFATLWARPEQFLDPHVRVASSAWDQLPPEISERALDQLRRDLESGAWDEAVRPPARDAGVGCRASAHPGRIGRVPNGHVRGTVPVTDRPQAVAAATFPNGVVEPCTCSREPCPGDSPCNASSTGGGRTSFVPCELVDRLRDVGSPSSALDRARLPEDEPTPPRSGRNRATTA